jgi:hypothetical protein
MKRVGDCIEIDVSLFRDLGEVISFDHLSSIIKEFSNEGNGVGDFL